MVRSVSRGERGSGGGGICNDERRHDEFRCIEMSEDRIERAKRRDGAAADDNLVILGDSVGHRLAVADGDDALGSPLPGIAAAPAYEGDAMHHAPVLDLLEATACDFVRKQAKRLAVDAMFRLERIAVPRSEERRVGREGRVRWGAGQ